MSRRAGGAAVLVVATFVAGISCTGRSERPAAASGAVAGGAFWEAECAACHARPDPSVARDADWIRHVSVTGCLDTPRGDDSPERREVMTFLRSPHVPPAVTRSADALQGRLSVPFSTGHVTLVHDGARELRVSFAGGVPSPDLLPPGDYRIRGYAIESEHDGIRWVLTSSALKGPAVSIRPGETTRLGIEAEVTLAVSVSRRDEGPVAAAVVTGFEGMGVSLFRDGRLVPLVYRASGPGGTPVASGTMTFG